MDHFRTTVSVTLLLLLLLLTPRSFAAPVIVITDLDFGQIPQPPRNTESDLVHVRVTSGRLGGRFFYRVSETGLPSDLPALMIPLGFFYHHTPYSLLPRTEPPLPRRPPPPFLPYSPNPRYPPAPTQPTAIFSAPPPHVALSTPAPPLTTTTDKSN